MTHNQTNQTNQNTTEENDPLPSWLRGRTFCTIKDLQRLFEVSRATIDRWSRDLPDFPKKVHVGYDQRQVGPVRFHVDELRSYVRKMIEGGGPQME